MLNQLTKDLCHPFEIELSVSAEDIEVILRERQEVPWADFLLNPRRLRGSDFLMRWAQGRWSEERLIEAINKTERYFALPYGPSGTAPDDDVREFELYFERLDKAGLGKLKRPDLLIFKKEEERRIEKIVNDLGGVQELPFTEENNDVMKEVLSKAVIAVECENSLWKAQMMPDYKTELSPQKRLGGKLGLKKAAVLPTIILKEEDRTPLKRWQENNGVEIHIWHVFYDMAFGINFDRAEDLIKSGLVLPTLQVFQAPGGPTTEKAIYKIYYHYAYPLGVSKEETTLAAQVIIDKNGHILPYVIFKGGDLEISSEVLDILDKEAE